VTRAVDNEFCPRCVASGTRKPEDAGPQYTVPVPVLDMPFPEGCLRKMPWGRPKHETRPRPAFGCLVRQPASSLRTSDIHRGTKGWGGPIPSPMLFTFARGDKVWTVRTRIVTATIGRSDHRGTYSHSRRSDISDTFVSFPPFPLPPIFA
jgi:hypothetical protein